MCAQNKNMTSFLTTSVFDSDIYTTSYGKTITAFSNPVCPSTYAGATQVYNPENGLCVSVPAATAVAAGATAAECGGAPFKIHMDGNCYSTNNCPASSSFSDTCLNTQNVPVRQLPFNGAGVIYNSVYGGK
jgi:hypothetical protein